jgi:signal recognition particle subunit SRP68
MSSLFLLWYFEKCLVLDVYFRFLHIILYQAERAWGYGMAIKQAIDGPNSRRRCHLIARLAKAAKWAELFSQACTEKADSRTSLEAAVCKM